jgi:hypothetical protein
MLGLLVAVTAVAASAAAGPAIADQGAVAAQQHQSPQPQPQPQQPPPPSKSWQVVTGAVLKGSDFKDPTVSFLAAAGPVTWPQCRDLCESNATCTSFDHVGGPITGAPTGPTQTGLPMISAGECYFRLDGRWKIAPNKHHNNTSGRRQAPAPPIPEPPVGAKNVLFVIFDDYRAMHKAYGWSQPHVPAADAFAKESLVFDRAYVQQAVCGPSRASLMSGRRPDRTQMWNFIGGFRATPGADKWNTMPEWFWKHGFYSAGCGKLYHPGDPADFDPDSWSEEECKLNFPYFGQGSCPVPKADKSAGCAVDPAVYPNTTFPDEETLAVALKFLRRASAQRNTTGQPFWLGVGFVKPHIPHVYPKRFGDLVPAPADIDLPAHPDFPTGCAPIEYMAKGPTHGIDKPATNESTQALRHAYYAAAAFSDSLLGELLAEVDALGLRSNTAGQSLFPPLLLRAQADSKHLQLLY